jgi:NADH:ubiquinone oxidoreductase subunit E
MTQKPTEDEAVRHLAEYMLMKDRYGNGLAPVEQAVQRHLRGVVDTIAAEIVAEYPGLRDRLDQMVRTTLEAVLRDEKYLERQVIEACSKALATRRAEVDE